MPNPSATTLLAYDRLTAAARRSRQAAQGRLEAARLPPADWYDILALLDRRGAMRPRDLVAVLDCEQYTVSRLLARMTATGLVSARPCPGDRRGQVIELTEAGAAARIAMWPVYAGAMAGAIEARLDPEERVQLAILLDKVA